MSNDKNTTWLIKWPRENELQVIILNTELNLCKKVALENRKKNPVLSTFFDSE